jgi:NAD(P)-dependent dehydrogenase (short-subunit alcohol dehydrogenase family)
LLLPVLERSAPSRVLIVAGSVQRFGKSAWDDLQCEQEYSMMRASGQSRVANLLFMRALTQRAKGVTVNAIDPGNTNTAIFPRPSGCSPVCFSRVPSRRLARVVRVEVAGTEGAR